MLPKQPPVHIFNTGTLEGGDDVKLAEYYGSYGFNAFYMKTGFLLGGYDYESEKNDPDNPLDRFAWSQRGDGYHETTRYGELEEEDRRNRLGTSWRSCIIMVVFTVHAHTETRSFSQRSTLVQWDSSSHLMHSHTCTQKQF